MNRFHVIVVLATHLGVLLSAGCAPDPTLVNYGTSLDALLVSPDAYEYRDADIPAEYDMLGPSPPPLSLSTGEVEERPMSLDEAFRLALSNARILRDLGARLLQSPDLANTIYDPSIIATDPRVGVAAALSYFDTNVGVGAFYERNDRVLNNELLGGGVNFFRQDLLKQRTQLSRRTLAGTELFLRNHVERDANNATQNLFDTAWDWNLEGEVRQPILQGKGIPFNSVAGSSTIPGIGNGVALARLNADMSIEEFQAAIQNLVSNVENAYWDLFFAYQDLHAKRESLRLTACVKDKVDAVTDTEKISKLLQYQANEQYYRFKQMVDEAQSGRPIEGTRTDNGSEAGTFQGGLGGVFAAERRLRLLIGLPINDGQQIRPITKPSESPIEFIFDDLKQEALSNRSELRRQRLRIRQRELDLAVARNYLLPRLDAVGRYRYRGLGDNLFDAKVPSPIDPSFNTDSNRHEWHLGVELDYPLGFRQAHAAVRNAQLRLVRDRAILTEMQRQVDYELSNAIAELDRAFQEIDTTRSRLKAAKDAATAQQVFNCDQKPELEVNYGGQLDAIRRLVDAEAAHYRAITAHAVAAKNVHFEKGTLLDYCGVYIADGESHGTTMNQKPRVSGDIVDYTISGRVVAEELPLPQPND